MSDCIFCKIAQGEMQADLVYQDDDMVAFRDINPQAPTHILIIPRQHIASMKELDEPHKDLVGRLFLVARDLAVEEGIQDDGYRVVMNCGAMAGQTVFHIHLHLLGGRRMTWPPG